MNPADTRTGSQLTMTHKMLSLLLATIWGATVALANSPQTASDLAALRSEGMAGREVAAAEPTAEPPTAGCDTRSGEVFLANGCCAIRGTSPSWAAVLRSEVSAIAVLSHLGHQSDLGDHYRLEKPRQQAYLEQSEAIGCQIPLSAHT